MTTTTERPTKKQAEKPRPQLPEGISDAAKRLLAKMEQEGKLLPGEIAQGMYRTLQNGQTLIADGYTVAYAIDPKTSLLIPNRFTVTRPAHKKPLMPLLPDGTREIRQYAVDARIVTNPETGRQEVRVQCDGRCGQAQGWEWCLHSEAIALMTEQSLRLIAHLTRQRDALPIAPIAIQESASRSGCAECGWTGWVYDLINGCRMSHQIPCPSCAFADYDPTDFYPEPEYHHDHAPVSAETRKLDWEN